MQADEQEIMHPYLASLSYLVDKIKDYPREEPQINRGAMPSNKDMGAGIGGTLGLAYSYLSGYGFFAILGISVASTYAGYFLTYLIDNCVKDFKHTKDIYAFVEQNKDKINHKLYQAFIENKTPSFTEEEVNRIAEQIIKFNLFKEDSVATNLLYKRFVPAPIHKKLTELQQANVVNHVPDHG